MKLMALQFLAMLATASAAKTISRPENVKSLLKHARRLDDGGNDVDVAAEIEEYLVNYSLKLRKCYSNQMYTDGYGDIGTGMVVFRLCPSNKCNDNKGCSSGYADFAVPLSTFVSYYMEDQADNMGWDDDKADENWAQCSQYEVENGNDDGISYYVGPSCTSDRNDVKLGLFTDAYCYEPAEKDFEDISNGWTLPYSDGGLVSTNCLDCGDELCLGLYEDVTYRCEEDWDVMHYYWDEITEVTRFGNDNTGCKSIANMAHPNDRPFDEWGGIVFVVFIVALSAGGAMYYRIWWEERKSMQKCVYVVHVFKEFLV